MAFSEKVMHLSVHQPFVSFLHSRHEIMQASSITSLWPDHLPNGFALTGI